MSTDLLCELMSVKGRLSALTEMEAEVYVGEVNATHILEGIKEDIDKMIAGELNAKQ